jgi:hypothetical protein
MPAAAVSLPRRRPLLAALALAGYAIHAGYHLAHGHPEDLLWACHIGAVLVGLGFLAASPTSNAIGFFWLLIGDALWGLDLAGGAPLLPTSLLTHGLGFGLSLIGLRSYGLPRHAWWQAVLAFLVLQQLCRWLTPPAANINLAFAVWSGWEQRFPSYPAYLAMLLTLALLAFFSVDRLLRRLSAPVAAAGAPAGAPADRRRS